ncbi:MAG: HAMP domain-containing histidine kinase, partial [Oscillospiraceae bacterium]|nr:HAMP domain-containing histidine kinase [Oscillospiraceae bacterium]
KNDLPFFFQTVDLARLCSNLVSTAAVMTGGKGISIGFSTPLGELYARADGEKIERILLNIISNSVAHTPAGGKITVGLEKSGDNAFISVTDTGCGIPAAEMAQLFTKFERDSISPSLSSLSTGGLGLGVARGLAEGHGGALIIESREGKGTCVRIMIPLRSSELTVLESPSSDYVNSGMSLILTELAPVLDAGSYESRFLD